MVVGVGNNDDGDDGDKVYGGDAEDGLITVTIIRKHVWNNTQLSQ